MPSAQENFQNEVAQVLEVAMFENWLRFYFIEEGEENGQEVLKIELPQKSMERISELYPNLLPLAEAMNGKQVDFEISRTAVLHHVLNHLDGKSLPRGEAQRILGSATFQVRLQLFHTWEQMHEDQLDQGFVEFGAWRNLFAQWLETPGATELAKKLLGKDK